MGEYVEVNLKHYMNLTDSTKKDIDCLVRDKKIAILENEQNKVMLVPMAHFNLIEEEIMKAKTRLELERKSVQKMHKKLLRISSVLKKWVREWEQFQLQENIEFKRQGESNDRNYRS